MADIYLDRRSFPNGRTSHIDLDNRFNLTQHIRTTISNGPSTNMLIAVELADAISDGSSEVASMTDTILGYINRGYTKLHIVCNFNGSTTGALTIPLIAIGTLPIQVFAGSGVIFTATFGSTTSVTFNADGDDTSDQSVYIS